MRDKDKNMKKHRAELYDKIQNVIGNYNDRMVRGIFQYGFDINTDILRAILVSFYNTSPITHSAFHKNAFTHYWIEKEFSEKDILTVKYTDTPRLEAEQFVCGVLPMDGNIQLKVAVFKDKSSAQSILAIITNHMYMDGGDLKYFIKTLCKAYNNALENKSYENLLKNGSRSYSTVYNDLDKKIKNKAMWLFSNPTPRNVKSFGLSNSSEKDVSFIITKNISSEQFDIIKDYGKKHNATINDMILTAYFLSLYKMGRVSPNEEVTISSAIDLRRYMADRDRTGITNHSSYLPFTIKMSGQISENNFDDVLHSVTEISHKYKNNPLTGLYGLPLLNFAYIVFPAFIADRLVKRFYNNPYLAISNIGVLHEDSYRMGEYTPENAFITGTVKYKPGIMVTVTTYRKEMTLSMCCRGNDADREMLGELLHSVVELLGMVKR